MTDLPHTQGGIPGRYHASGGHLNLAKFAGANLERPGARNLLIHMKLLYASYTFAPEKLGVKL